MAVADAKQWLGFPIAADLKSNSESSQLKEERDDAFNSFPISGILIGELFAH